MYLEALLYLKLCLFLVKIISFFVKKFQVMDYKVADLRKKLNKLKYSTGTKTDRIARLMKDYEKVVNMNAEIVSFLSSLRYGNTGCGVFQQGLKN
jgi:hypothetical protein